MAKLKLILMRHGEASSNGLNDKSRILTAHGTTQAVDTGNTLNAKLGNCDIAIVSTATRAQQTAEHVLANLQAKLTAHEPSLYTANSSPEFISIISKYISHDYSVILVIGHNPVISTTASDLAGTHLGFSPAEYVILSIESLDWVSALHSNGCWAIE